MRDGSASEMALGERGRAQVVGLAADGSRVESCPYPSYPSVPAGHNRS